VDRGVLTAALIGLSPAGETAEVELPRLFAKRTRILTSHGGDHLSVIVF
jgi:hypothetical protein